MVNESAQCELQSKIKWVYSDDKHYLISALSQTHRNKTKFDITNKPALSMIY